MKIRPSIVVLITALVLGAGEFARSAISTTSQAPSASAVPLGRYGITCNKSYECPLATGPASYLVSDLGKPGVPRPSAAQASLVRQIARYRSSRTLRFLFLNDRLVVFDAKDGPCSGSANAYEVLNGAPNLFYSPGENPYVLKSGSNDITTEPRPWGTSDP